MSARSLYTTHPIINGYRPYIGFNHHNTQLGFNCEMIGDVLTILPQDIYFIVRQGNRPETLPPYATGTATSATSTTITDTSKNFLSSTLSWLGDWDRPWIHITGGTGAGQSREITYTGANTLTVGAWTTQPDNTSTYCIGKQWNRVRSEFQDQIPNLYLPHDEYTIWTMVFDSGGIPRVSRNYININAYLASLPPVHNSITPQIIFKKENIIGGNSVVRVRARKGDTVKLYWKYSMDEDKLKTLYPDIQDGTADHGSGIVLAKKRGLSFRGNPLASGVVSADNGEIEFTLPATSIAADANDRWVCASSQTEGFGESFSTNWVKVFQQTGPPYTPDAEDTRQNKVIFTATNTTRNTKGYLEKLYNVEVKNIDLYSGAESGYASQADFYYNENNNGDANNISIAGGIWAKVGGTTTTLIIDHNANGATAGTPKSYWSQHIIDAATPTPSTKTPYTSLADAITRGPNTQLPKDQVTWYSDGFDLGDKLYINNNPDDTTTAPAGFYFIPDMSMAVQIDIAGVIISRQVVGGVAQY